MNKNIYLTGFMGSGKSTCAKILSQRTGLKYLDTDILIENDFSMSTFDIIEKFGIEYFRKIENQKLSHAVQQNSAVVSLGGGTLILSQNQKQVLKNGILIYLKWNADDLIKNLRKIQKRPLLKNINTKSFDILFRERSDGYEKAHFVVECEKKNPETVVNEIQDFLKKNLENDGMVKN